MELYLGQYHTKNKKCFDTYTSDMHSFIIEQHLIKY